MRKAIMVLFAILALAISSTAVMAAKACTTIQDGTLYTSDNRLITPGYDIWGYNYQARMFNGGYCDAYRNAAWCQPYKDVSLMMKWNDAWLSNKDCDGDGLLDRNYGYSSYIGSGAWLTNHMSGANPDGTVWTDFVKIVAKPTAGFNCASAGGAEIWGSFCIIQEVLNDPS